MTGQMMAGFGGSEVFLSHFACKRQCGRFIISEPVLPSM
jgi:hypothetical protein